MTDTVGEEDMKYKNSALITVDEIKEILTSYDLEYKTNEGYDGQMNTHFYDIQVICEPYFVINIEDEYTIFFADWHGHYDPNDKESMKSFKADLEAILDNEKCSVASMRLVDGVENFCCVALEWKECLDRDYLEREYGKDRIIRCRFLDESLNKTILT